MYIYIYTYISQRRCKKKYVVSLKRLNAGLGSDPSDTST